MNQVMYFVIHNSEGDTNVVCLSKEELEKRLNQKYWGEDIKFLQKDALLDEPDTDYWGEDEILIIEGRIANPAPTEVVMRYKL